jgi:heterodisulfide reductase subunit B
MRLSYYPGCTLKDRTTNLGDPTLQAARILGLDLVELTTWTCCGATYPLTDEKIVNLVPQIRILRDVRQEGNDRVTTTCSFCYNSLKRANRAVREDPITRRRLNAFLDDEAHAAGATASPYAGDVHVVHFLQLLRDTIGFDELAQKVSAPLQGLKVAPYYGCQLLRPPEVMELDDPENPTILEDCIQSLGALPVDFPFRNECCGSYVSLLTPDAATRASHAVLRSAQRCGAEAITLSCPLCYYNLDQRQADIADRHDDIAPLPVLFFTQLLALALGVDPRDVGLDQHRVDPRPILKGKGLLRA